MKKFAALMIALILALSCFAVAEEESYTIGIAQFAEHGSLDNCREGFLAGLAEEGIVEGENLTVEYQNAQADTSMATTIASNFVANGYDLICAIATPIAVCAYNAAEDEIPVIYTAVSAPEEAGLTDGGNVTGTSDELPVAKQLETIRAMLPEAKNIGILYTVGEANSLVQLESYKAAGRRLRLHHRRKRRHLRRGHLPCRAAASAERGLPDHAHRQHRGAVP